MDGLMGKLLFIDLGTKKTEVKSLDEATAKNFLGGPALGAKILYDEMPAHTDEFAPESMIGFVAGALNSTGAHMAGRYTVVSKSPVTKGWNDANSGGVFGPTLKKTGYDGIFIKGVSPTPVYIFVDDGKVEFHDATAIWGKTIVEGEKAIKAELGDEKVCIAQIGPAGERKSWMSGIVNDDHRIAARGGSGAVMGSKNLKALVIRGSQTPTIADKEALDATNKEIIGWQMEGPVKDLVAGFKELGTPILYEGCIMSGDCGVKNWSGVGSVDLTEEQRKAPTTLEKWKKKKYLCAQCTIGCGAHIAVNEGGLDIPNGSRPEYETMGAFGSNLMCSDPITITYASTMCNEYGLDSISTGGTIAWAMECCSNGILSKDDLDGIDLVWGNTEAVKQMLDKICKGEGVGKILQNGSRYAAEHFGKGQEALVEFTGIEPPMHDIRFSPGMARTFQYDPTPGRHTRGGTTPQYGNNPPEVKYNYDNTADIDVAGAIAQEILSAGGFCQFAEFGVSPGGQIGLINAATGFGYTEDESNKYGLRAFCIRHAFNLREGFRRDYWTTSQRQLGNPPQAAGPAAGQTIDGKKIADNFFAKMGFDQDAVPLKKTLEDIGGLDNVIKDLYPNG